MQTFRRDKALVDDPVFSQQPPLMMPGPHSPHLSLGPLTFMLIIESKPRQDNLALPKGVPNFFHSSPPITTSVFPDPTLFPTSRLCSKAYQDESFSSRPSWIPESC